MARLAAGGRSDILTRIGFLLAICASSRCGANGQVNASAGEWTWMGGSNTGSFHPGAYGTLGTPTPTNTPGQRDEATRWTDSHGNLWLFGGEGLDSVGKSGLLNDLWKFDPAANMWTWMGGTDVFPNATSCPNCGGVGVYGTLGSASPGNLPGARLGAVGWTDNSGNLWIFGGIGFATSGPQGYLNDLWKFDIVSNE